MAVMTRLSSRCFQPLLADQLAGKGNPIFDILYHPPTLLIEFHMSAYPTSL
jgi:hypothetical protein